MHHRKARPLRAHDWLGFLLLAGILVSLGAMLLVLRWTVIQP